jgi:hypothetical protein
MSIETIVMIANLIVYNVAIIRLLSYVLTKIDIGNALTEKSPQKESAPPPAGIANVAQQGQSDVSYSRVAGAIGAIVLASFFWAVGNVILYKAFSSISDIRELVSSLGTFFLAGASMFLPYAFNQLRAVFT